jgi:type II secretory pathway pseudopilin PulG
MTGRNVLAAVIATVLATAVLPPAAAWSVNRARLNRAGLDVSELARRLRARDAEVRRLAAETDVLYGPGQMPTADTAETKPWVSVRRTSLAVALGDVPLTPDPWGNSYIVNVAVLGTPGSPLWIVSAGPNGIVEIPFSGGAEGSTAGDDVAVRIR